MPLSRSRRVLLFPLTRIVLAIALVVGLMAATGALLRLGHVHTSALFWSIAGSVASLIALTVVGRGVEKRTFAELGIHPRRIARDLALGFGIGGAIFVAVVGILTILGDYHGALSSDAPSAIAGTLMFFFFVALNEELLFRSIFFRIVEDGLGSWGAVALSAALFGAVHLGNPGATWVAGIAIALEAGILLAALYMLTRSLAVVTGLHWAWNFFEGGVFGVPVSGQTKPSLLRGASSGSVLLTGGDFGPEAGLVAVVFCGVVATVVLVLAVRRGQIMAPAWVRRQRTPSSHSPSAIG